MTKFKELLLSAQRDSPKPWRDALVSVADTAFMCIAWLEDNAPKYTPADLLAMTRMVIEQERIQTARLNSGDILHELDAALLTGKPFYFSAHISPAWVNVMRRLAEQRCDHPAACEAPHIPAIGG